MFNAYPLNAVPLNGLGSSGIVTQIIEPGSSFSWSPRLLLDGDDVTDQLLGAIVVDRSESGDAVASFQLWLGTAPVSIGSYSGRSVVIDIILHGEPEVVSRRFTGQLVQPEFDVVSRVLSCEANTRLAENVEAMSIAAIDTLVGGLWSPDVFEDVAGRSRWDYAQERLSTRTASLNADRYGVPRITPWHIDAVHYEFAPGSTVHESVDVGLATLSDAVNVYELELDYRYTRYRQRRQSYTWRHTGTGGNMSLAGFNAWRADSTELPDVDMITEAVNSAGWYLSSSTWYRLYGDLPDLPQPWYNKNTDLLLGADFSASIRWSQRAVEKYTVRLEVADSVAAVGEVIERGRVVLDTDTENDRLWDESTGDLVAAVTDAPIDQLQRRDPERLAAAFDCAVSAGVATLCAAQRANVVTWQVPLAHALAIDFGHRLRLRDQGADVTGMVVMLTEEMDTQTGTALLTIGIAPSLGAATAIGDIPVLPDPPEFEDQPGPVMPGSLPTQIGLRIDSPPYDEELPGFAGNYSIGNGDPADRYPRRFAIDTPEILEQWRNEIEAAVVVTYSIAPPADTLEL